MPRLVLLFCDRMTAAVFVKESYDTVSVAPPPVLPKPMLVKRSNATRSVFEHVPLTSVWFCKEQYNIWHVSVLSY